MIFPVAVTLKRFLALEFVFTLGIVPSIKIIPLRRSPPGDAYGASSGNVPECVGVKELTFGLQR
jgi:hypothetical protein